MIVAEDVLALQPRRWSTATSTRSARDAALAAVGRGLRRAARRPPRPAARCSSPPPVGCIAGHRRRRPAAPAGSPAGTCPTGWRSTPSCAGRCCAGWWCWARPARPRSPPRRRPTPAPPAPSGPPGAGRPGPTRPRRTAAWEIIVRDTDAVQPARRGGGRRVLAAGAGRADRHRTSTRYFAEMPAAARRRTAWVAERVAPAGLPPVRRGRSPPWTRPRRCWPATTSPPGCAGWSIDAADDLRRALVARTAVAAAAA